MPESRSAAVMNTPRSKRTEDCIKDRADEILRKLDKEIYKISREIS